MKWLLKGGTILDPATGNSEVNDILIDGGRIAAIGRNLISADTECGVEDIRGKTVTAGFIDMHVHLREPGREDKETIQSGGRAAARGGFVAIAAMPNTHPPIDSVASVGYVKARGREVSPSRVYPIACITKAQAGQEITEFASLAEAGAIAFSDDGKCVMNADLMRRALEYARMLDAVLIGHEEDEHLTNGGHAHEGFQSVVLGLGGMPSVAEDVIVSRDIQLAQFTGGRVHIAHVSSARSVQMVREAKKQGLRITCEVTPHHLLLTDEALTTYDPNYKMNPPLRSEADRQALIEGLKDGTIDAIATDHAPHTREEKEVEFGIAAFGVIGLETAVPVLLDRLVASRTVPLERIVAALTIGPARILNLDLGTISVGAPACFTVLDLEAKETIDLSRFESKSRNCPFGGWTVKGLPVMTVVDGRVVMKNRAIVEEWRPRSLAHAM
jgi:dihydroorotase